MIPAAHAWLDSLRPYAEEHERACVQPLHAQKQILEGLLQKNRDTVFGQDHLFSSISNYKEYKDCVPVRNYEGFDYWMKRVLSGEQNVLTSEQLIGFEQTSGSSGGSKIIPITETFRKQMTVAIAGWMHRWGECCPEVFSGSAYWSISPPAMKPELTPGGVRIGMEDDGAYFPSECARHLGGMLVVPEWREDFFGATVESLLECRDLASISVWSPTFFLQLDQAVRARNPEFQTWSLQWPNLQLLSCWTDAQASIWLDDVRKCLGGINIESKGLLATEGVSSVPDVGTGRRIMAAGSHFMEFMSPDGTCVMCDEVTAGESYEIILSTGAGLYRYRTMDTVRIDSLDDHGLPSLTFTGRSGRNSDLVGEKLTEVFVAECMRVSRTQGVLSAEAGGYRFYTEREQGAEQLELELCNNPYYAQALKLGQLDSMEIKRMNRGFQLEMIRRRSLATGARLGDVKLPALLLLGEQEGWFGL